MPSLPSGGDSSRSAAVAALGHRHRRENGAQLRHGVEKPSLWRPVASVPAYPAYIP